MPRWCFSCEGVRALEFTCRACGERECAVCVDATAGLCGDCAYELQSRRELDDVITRGADS